MIVTYVNPVNMETSYAVVKKVKQGSWDALKNRTSQSFPWKIEEEYEASFLAKKFYVFRAKDMKNQKIIWLSLGYNLLDAPYWIATGGTQYEVFENMTSIIYDTITHFRQSSSSAEEYNEILRR
ncbi:MAG: hypothetical protein EBR94_01165 [Bacteroidetes bacterium]|nr:hypothetical protein [Bacteroidota bacterium]